MTSHQGQSKKIEGAPKVLCPKYGAILTIISGVTIFCSVGQTEPVFKLNRFKNSDLRSKTKRIPLLWGYVKKVKNVYPVTGNFALEAIMI